MTEEPKLDNQTETFIPEPGTRAVSAEPAQAPDGETVQHPRDACREGVHHPRPLMFRPEWTPLNGFWRFAFDDAGRWKRPGEVKNWTHTICVPFPPESSLSGIGDPGFHPACWYEREFEITAGRDRVLLHFGAVDYAATVWVNGQLAMQHEGGHTPFSAEITFLLHPGPRQTVTVLAEDDPLDLAKPRGKQDWKLKPHSIWYPRTTGIWQTVWLERVPRTYVSSLRWTPRLERYEIGLEVRVEGDMVEGVRAEVELRAAGRRLACDSYEVILGEVHRRIGLSDPGIDDFRNELLWSPRSPTLIDARVRLLRGDEVLDEVLSYTALRNVSVEQRHFMLNGRPFYMRMVLDQGYWPESVMTAPSDAALRRDIELIKAMGFNGVRLHQKIECPRFLYWADVLGLLVWEEMPAAYRFTDRSVQRLIREWTEVVNRDYSHPCIAVWVPFNESWGVPDLIEKATHRSCVQALYHLTKTLDSTRPVIGNDGWESTATDIVGIHDYDDDPKRLSERYAPDANVVELLGQIRPGGRAITIEGYPHLGQPLMLTEFGGVAYVGEDAPKDSWGYSVCRTTSRYKGVLRELLAAVHEIAMFSGFCYTQFADTFQERNGLLYGNRQPKIPMKDIHRAIRGPRFERDEAALEGMGPSQSPAGEWSI